jgi:hypothetical protein
MATKNTETIHELTTAEISRQQSILAARLREIITERADDYRKALKSGAPSVFDADELASREHARVLLNGAAPESLSMPLMVNRDKMLIREQRGIEIAMKVLASKDLVARATEAIRWAEEHADEWRALCREIVLTAVRLDALEANSQRLLERCIDVSAISLPMASKIGGRSISETPVSELTEAALAAGVVTASEIRKAKSNG